MPEVKDYAGARAQVVYEPRVRPCDIAAVQAVHLGNPDLERRLMNIVRQLQPQAETGRAERILVIGAEALTL